MFYVVIQEFDTMNIRLSIIVPFYNVETYIEQCIRSLYDQDIPHDQYEVICVDDHSPDGSRAIVERLQKELPSLLLLLLPENRKLGGARNEGLKVARGKYIWFVDSDDYVAPNCFKALLNDAEQNNVDMLHFDYCSVCNETVQAMVQPYEEDGVVSGEDFFVDESHELWYQRCPVVWRRLHRRDFILDNQLYFVEKMMYEDTDLSLYMFTLAKRVKHIAYAPYYYRLNPESITHKKRTPQTMMYTILQQNRCLRAYNAAPTEAYREIIRKYIHSQLTVLRREIKELSYKNKLIYFNLLRSHSIRELRAFCNWRTWLTIKYGITCFVK